MSGPIYLDHHATTPCLPEVVEAMLPYLTENFGNPASITHEHGRRAATALEEARSSVASFLGVRPSEVYFTSGATEANNIVLQSAQWRAGDHVISTPVEHKSVLAPLERLRDRGVRISYIDVDREGFVDVAALEKLLDDSTRLVSVIAANGEIGTIQPIERIASVCRERKVWFHTDATQAVGKIPISGVDIPFDFLSLSAHKIYGPKGVGALVVRRGARVAPLMVGGGQEKGLRSGTVNVAGAVALARALEIRSAEMEAEASRLTQLRNHLWNGIGREIADATVHGPRALRLPGNLNVSFRYVESETLMLAMRRFSLSSGSACSSADREPSHVLRAIGVSDDLSFSSIRFGLGRGTTMSDIDMLIEDLQSNVARLREIAPRI